MEKQTELITIIDFMGELGYKKPSFYRRLKRLGLKPPGKILSPADQNYYRREMGHLPKFPELPLPLITLQILTNETKRNIRVGLTIPWATQLPADFLFLKAFLGQIFCQKLAAFCLIFFFGKNRRPIFLAKKARDHERENEERNCLFHKEIIF